MDEIIKYNRSVETKTMPNNVSLVKRDVSSKLRRLDKHDLRPGTDSVIKTESLGNSRDRTESDAKKKKDKKEHKKQIDKYRIESFVKHGKDKKKSKQDVDSKMAVSMQKLSLGTTKTPKNQFAKSVGRNMKSHIMTNLVMWVEKVFAEVGPDKKENIYQNKLKDLFLSLVSFLET